MTIADHFLIYVETNDGSLPGITISGVDVERLSDLYRFMRQRSTFFGSAEMWDELNGVDVPIATIDDPAAWVSSGRSTHFHDCVAAFTPGDASPPLPVLGIALFAESLGIDWRMGEWSREQVEAFIAWLADLARPPMRVELDDAVPRVWTDQFRTDFDRVRLTR